ncbi:AdeC/AdeK/OprM family multidrug efflux complex outer membrane factor [Solimonas soli]|uniref:AdeC/AdeK/OprM family multidrug efflux complex outer membrane factor n=1 Tax=Solimonas soli TaxID=413479 RepID=UPI00047F161A|nr:AdeC/AdeK/OprM family multidrug efflux complex outer membrane factor [Solimonas soli]
MNLRFTMTALAAALLASACTLEPRYQRPAAPVAAAYPDAGTGAASTPAAADLGWRDFFADPRLQKLVEIALANNRDLRVSMLNVEAARAQYRIQRAELLPAIAGTGTGSGQRTPDDLTSNPDHNVSHNYSVGVGFTSYELDLFGRVRSLKREALETYLGYEETRRSAQITLVAEVANAYLSWLADQELLRVTQDTFDSQQQSFALTQKSFDAGAVGALDLRQAQTALETARANLAQYQRQATLDRNALVLLLGVPALPADLPQGRDLDTQELLTELPAGLPSEVLARRPDVLAAEHDLRAANANIGAARAAFFPRITLTGSYGTASSEFRGLFDAGSDAWSFAPTITVPIFSGGANRAGLDLATVQKNIYVAQYERTIQNAFREVADALGSRATLDAQLAAQQTLLEASGESYRLAELRFRAGVDSYLTTLDAQRSLYAAQQGYVSIKLARLQNLVTLYKALGGGWNESTAAQPGAGPAAP